MPWRLMKIDQSIGPGLGGFLVTFFMAVALVLLVRSMTKHLRKVRYGPDPAQRVGRQTMITGRVPDQAGPGGGSGRETVDQPGDGNDAADDRGD